MSKVVNYEDSNPAPHIILDFLWRDCVKHVINRINEEGGRLAQYGQDIGVFIDGGMLYRLGARFLVDTKPKDALHAIDCAEDFINGESDDQFLDGEMDMLHRYGMKAAVAAMVDAGHVVREFGDVGNGDQQWYLTLPEQASEVAS